MKSIRNLVASVTVAVSLAGCSGDSITATPDNSLAPLSVSASAAVARPWKGTCDAEAVFTSGNTLLITGTCQLAHLGRTTLVATETVEPQAGGFYVRRAATYTAANGDQLRTTAAGVALYKPDFSGLLLAYIETADGGTGRFSGATGTATLTGATSFATLKGYWTFDGTLGY